MNTSTAYSGLCVHLMVEMENEFDHGGRTFGQCHLSLEVFPFFFLQSLLMLVCISFLVLLWSIAIHSFITAFYLPSGLSRKSIWQTIFAQHSDNSCMLMPCSKWRWLSWDCWQQNCLTYCQGVCSPHLPHNTRQHPSDLRQYLSIHWPPPLYLLHPPAIPIVGITDMKGLTDATATSSRVQIPTPLSLKESMIFQVHCCIIPMPIPPTTLMSSSPSSIHAHCCGP